MKKPSSPFLARICLTLLCLTLSLTGCARTSAPSSSSSTPSSNPSSASSSDPSSDSSEEELSSEPSSEPVSAPQGDPETDTARPFTITVNGVTFTGTLHDNPTAEAFAELFPLTLSMDEFGGNEKFYNLSDPLPTDAYRPGQIRTGDVKLYTNNCIVLFFDDFATQYSYTDIGTLDSPENLAEVLGSGTVEVTFALPEDTEAE